MELTSLQMLNKARALTLQIFAAGLRNRVAAGNPPEYALRGRIEGGYLEALNDVAGELETEAEKIEQEAANG
jgi:hypothetical protein